MSSTSSANSTALPDRRHFLSTLAGAGVLALPTLAPVAFAEAGDAHLLDLGRQLAKFTALDAEADRHLSEIEARYDQAAPQTPEVLIVRADDRLAMRKRPEMRAGQPTGRLEYDVDLKVAQEQLASWSKFDPKAIRRVSPEIDALLVRLREIVDGHTAWREEQSAARDAAGIPEAEDAAEEAGDRRWEVMCEITRCPATTLVGLALKARVAMQCMSDTLDEAEAKIDSEIDGGASAETLGLSIVRDLMRMAPRIMTGGAHA